MGSQRQRGVEGIFLHADFVTSLSAFLILRCVIEHNFQVQMKLQLGKTESDDHTSSAKAQQNQIFKKPFIPFLIQN